MASRLFRAVVGVGIALGTSSVACFGGADDPPLETSPDAAQSDSSNQRSDGAPATDANRADVEPRSDAGADAADAGDAALDAPTDAMLDAFCDASWPTTKGNPGGPTCGDITDCADAGFAPHCLTQVQATRVTCDPGIPSVPAWCVAGQWRCSGAAIPETQCECWLGEPCP